jgi:hypothetical protein
MGRGEIWVRRKWIFYQRIVHTNTHNFEAKKNPRQKPHDAAVWASFAPLLLHCRNHCGGTHMLPILAQSEGEEGGGGNQQNWQGSAPPLPKIIFLFSGFVFESAGSSHEKKKKKWDGKTAIPVLDKNKG